MATILGWLPRTEARGKWLVRSPITELRQHFFPELGCSCRCNAPDFCPICAAECSVQVHWALPISLDGSDKLRILRLMRKDQHSIDWCLRQGARLVGTLIDLSIVGYIDIRPIARRVMPAVPVENYLKAIGRKAYFAAIDSLREREAAVDSSEPEELCDESWGERKRA